MAEGAAAASSGRREAAVLDRLAALQKDLKTKKTFVAACAGLAELCEEGEQGASLPAEVVQGLTAAGKSAIMVLRARFSNPKFWQAGLEFFLALEFHVPAVAEAAEWRTAAMEEVDEDVRESARRQRELRRLEEEKRTNQGMWSDSRTPVSMAELAAAAGVMLVEEGGRPGMSRDAQHELRLVTVTAEEVCVVCQEALPLGSKAKAMPCGHLFHDECLGSWVKNSNSCPICRFDELPSEKRHFDDVTRRIEEGGASSRSLYT